MTASPRQPLAVDPLVRVAILFLALVAALTLATPLVRLPLWLEQPNEGWNAIHTFNAFTRALYPAQPAPIVNNYPPLSFYAVGALTALTGDPVLTGRAIAFVSFLITAGAIGLILLRFGARRPTALIGALTFVATIAGLFALYVGLDDPQMLAHAIVTSSVAALIGASRRRTAALAAVGVVAGLMVKQIVIGLPLGMTLWLAIHRRDLLLPWIATGVGATVAALGLCVTVYGEPFIANLTFPRVPSWPRLRFNIALTLKPAVSLLAFAAVMARRRAWRDPALMFAACAIAGGGVEILLFGSALGVGVNVAFDLVIAASIATGLTIDRLASIPNGARLCLLVVFAIGLRILIGASDPLNAVAARPYLLRQQADVERAVAMLRPLPGPLLCEPLATCALAGHPSVADLWKLRFESTLTRFRDTRPLFVAIAQRRYAAVVTAGNLNTPADDKFMPGLHDALHAAYGEPVRIGDSFFVFLRRAD